MCNSMYMLFVYCIIYIGTASSMIYYIYIYIYITTNVCELEKLACFRYVIYIYMYIYMFNLCTFVSEAILNVQLSLSIIIVNYHCQLSLSIIITDYL